MKKQLLNSTSIPNTLLETLFVKNSEFTEQEKDMLLYICRKTIGWQKETDWLTLNKISKDLNKAKSHCSAVLESLCKKGAIIKERKGKTGWVVGLNVERWGVTYQVTKRYLTGNEALPDRERHLTKETITKDTKVAETSSAIPDPSKRKEEKSPQTPKKKNSWAYELIDWLEKEQGCKFAIKGKQYGALGNLKKAGYTPEQIKECYYKMMKDDFWKNRSPDFQNIAANITKFIKKEKKFNPLIYGKSKPEN